MPKASNSVKHRNLICFSKKLQQIFVYFQFFIMYPIIEACRLEFYSGFDSLKFMRKSSINKQITFFIKWIYLSWKFLLQLCFSCGLEGWLWFTFSHQLKPNVHRRPASCRRNGCNWTYNNATHFKFFIPKIYPK